MSRQKDLIYHIIRESDRHLTAAEIYALAHEQMPNIAQGTVYRNLAKMTEDGLIGRLEMSGDAPARYDREHTPHPHLVCERCGKMQDLFDFAERLQPVLDALPVQYTGYDFRVFYICPDCKKTEDTK